MKYVENVEIWIWKFKILIFMYVLFYIFLKLKYDLYPITYNCNFLTFAQYERTYCRIQQCTSC